MMKRSFTLVAVVAGSLVLGACGSEGEAKPTAEATPVTAATAAAHDHDAISSESDEHAGHAEHSTLSSSSESLQCAMHMPGDILSEDEAMVVFDSQHVCLSYVTVTAGTAVSWHNADAAAQSVTVLDSDDAVVTTLELASNDMGSYTFDEPGLYEFSHTAIDGFTGTVEVQEP